MKERDFILQSFVDACRMLVRYNTITGELYLLKTQDSMFVDIEEVQSIDGLKFVRDFLEQGVVYTEDVHYFENLFDMTLIRSLCETRQSGALFVYRRLNHGELIWCRLNMLVPYTYSEKNPYTILFVRDMPMAEAEQYEAWSLMGNQVHKITRVNLTTGETKKLKEYEAETFLHRKYTAISFAEGVRLMKDSFVHPDDQEAFARHMDADYILHHFMEGNAEYQFYYRRKIKGLFRWVRLTVIPSADRTPENEVYYCYVADMHRTIVKMLDIRAATKYAMFFSHDRKQFSEGYYENLLEVLTTFTQSYLDYFFVDLEKDIYINYKLSHNSVDADMPYIGKYSQIISEYLDRMVFGEGKERLSSYALPQRLRDRMKDRMTLTYTFQNAAGMSVTTTCVKLESRNGIPTKIICSTLPAKGGDKPTVQTFGNFEVYGNNGNKVRFTGKQTKQLFAYLIDRQGYPVTSKDIVTDVLEKDAQDIRAVKYVSTLIRRMMQDLENAGYPQVVIKEHKTIRVNPMMVDCDYYHLMNGERNYWEKYHNEYMKEYSWAEETNAELQSITEM